MGLEQWKVNDPNSTKGAWVWHTGEDAEDCGGGEAGVEGVSKVENAISIVLILLAPCALVYGWFFISRRMATEAASWRNRISVLSLSLISFVALLWPVMMGLALRANGKGIGVDEQWIEAWHKLILRTLLAALILGFLGRPRLILPIAVASIGTAMFWILSTMP